MPTLARILLREKPEPSGEPHQPRSLRADGCDLVPRLVSHTAGSSDQRCDVPTDERERGAPRPPRRRSIDRATQAWIEVELGTNPAQVDQYRARLIEPIRTVWGRVEHGGDLSFEQIADRLEQLTPDVGSQVRFNCDHLARQIRQELDGFRGSAPRTDVSAEMRAPPRPRLDGAAG